MKWKESVGSFVVTLSEVIQRLCDAKVDFVIVGGFAATFYQCRMPITRNLEICTPLGQPELAKLRDLLRDLNPRHRPTSKTFLTVASQTDSEIKELHLETEAGALDFASSILGVGDFDRVRAAAIEIELFGRRCRVISLEDLIQAKEALARDKDLLAAKELRAIREKLKQS